MNMLKEKTCCKFCCYFDAYITVALKSTSQYRGAQALGKMYDAVSKCNKIAKYIAKACAAQLEN